LRQPLLIAQGLADDLVRPDVQSRFARGRCDAGVGLQYRTYAGRDHLSVVAPDSPLTRDLVQWTRTGSTRYRCQRTVTEKSRNNRSQRTAPRACAELER